METTPNSRKTQKERNVGEHDVSALKLEFVELKAQFSSLSEDVKAIRDFIKESQAPKPINYPAWIGAFGTMIFLVCAVLMMWVKPLEMKLEVQAEKVASFEKNRKEDYSALKDSLMERIDHSFDRFKTDMKIKGLTP